jgi:hypothetical protein
VRVRVLLDLPHLVIQAAYMPIGKKQKIRPVARAITRRKRDPTLAKAAGKAPPRARIMQQELQGTLQIEFGKLQEMEIRLVSNTPTRPELPRTVLGQMRIGPVTTLIVTGAIEVFSVLVTAGLGKVQCRGFSAHTPLHARKRKTNYQCHQ